MHQICWYKDKKEARRTRNLTQSLDTRKERRRRRSATSGGRWRTASAAAALHR
jgi:hypothetical protein